MPLPDRSRFRHWAQDHARYGDTDRQGHVNNAVFATFLETGRVGFLYDRDAPLSPPGTEFVIARLALDFRAELDWRGAVAIGSIVTALGRSSCTIAQAIYQGERCCATAETVIVLMDTTTRHATALPEATRMALAAIGEPGIV